MGRPAGWMTELTGRGPMRSPGAPSHPREIEREFWRQIAKGLLPEEAAHVVGASQAVGSSWFRHSGGMSPFDLDAFSGRYLSFREREEIALMKARGAGVREIAHTIGRSPSTVSREVRRNVATRAASLGIGRLLRNGRPNSWHAARRHRNWSPTRSFTPTSRIGCPDRSACLTERLFSARRPERGRSATSSIAKTGHGCRGGVRSRSPTGSRSTSPMMSPCASATRRSTGRSTFRAVAHSNASSSCAYEPVAHCEHHERDHDARYGPTSLRRHCDQRSPAEVEKPCRSRPLVSMAGGQWPDRLEGQAGRLRQDRRRDPPHRAPGLVSDTAAPAQGRPDAQ
jgi:DNA-binding CsgD family transcriptional regulator